MNVDDAIRGLRGSMPGPPSDLADRIVASASSGPVLMRRPRITGRGTLVAATVVIAAVVLITVGLLIHSANRPDPEPATPVIPPARVDWGQIVTVRLAPDPGISIKEMRERFTTALAFRAYDNGGAGVEVLSEKGNEVQIRLPGVSDGSGDSYVSFSRLVLLDDDAGVLASGPDLSAIDEKARRLAPEGTRVVYYTQVYIDHEGWSAPARFEAKRDVEKWRAASDPGARTAVAVVPADTIVTQGDEGSVRLIRPVQAVPSSSVRAMHREGNAVVVTIDPLPAAVIGHQISAYMDPEGRARSDRQMAFIGSDTVTASGQLRLPVGKEWSTVVARPDIGGQVVFVRARTYGRASVESTGGYPEYQAPPAWNRQLGNPPKGTRWVLLAKGVFGGEEHVLVAPEYRRVLLGERVFNVTERKDVIGGTPRIDGPDDIPTSPPFGSCGTDGVISGVTTCSGSLSDGPWKNGHVAFEYARYGRVGPDVARIVVKAGGAEQDAVISGSWWLVSVYGEHSEQLDPMKFLSDVSVEAWDRDGNPVPGLSGAIRG